ncbi:MAG: hypothetical protein QOK40_1864 [Miltoncostaeaceae bacterium]|jgi:hypothetical protein|nr:hypothetical protein [Miltoncostaeaceae bacterium]
MNPLVLSNDGDAAVAVLAQELAIPPAEAVERAVRLALMMRHLTMGFHGLSAQESATR